MGSHIYEAMRPYQREGAHWMRRTGNALLTDQPGLGKTIQTLGTIIATAKTEDRLAARWHLIACPSVAVTGVWGPEIRRWLRDHPVEVLALTGPLADREAALRDFEPRPETRHVFVVVNIEAVRINPAKNTFSKSLRKHQIIRYTVKRKDKDTGKVEKVQMAYHATNAVLRPLFERVWDTVVVDESHRALIRTEHIPTQTRAGFVLLATRRRLALSGTPMRGKPEQLWGTLNWLRPDLYTSYWKWVKLYFEVTADGFSSYIVGGLTRSGESRLALDLRSIALRRTKAEVAPELPPKTFAGSYLIEGDEHSPLGVWLPMEPKQAKQYDSLLIDGLLGDSMVNGSLAMYTRQRQIAGCFHEVYGSHDVVVEPVVKGSPKYEWLANWLDNANGEKIVVVSQYTSILTAYADALSDAGYYTVSITGRVTGRNRDSAVEQFQNGDAQVMLLNIQAGGVALTLDAADYMVLLDETTIPDETEQVIDRIHRISRVHNVTIYMLRTLGTIEEEVAYIAAAREDVQQYLLDGARGVEHARQVYLLSRERITA